MRKLNKYERRMMWNLHIITFLAVLASVLNLVLPLAEKPTFTIFIITQFAAIGGIYVYGWISSRRTQIVPVMPTFLIRAFQAFIFVFWRDDLSWTAFGVLVFLDILFLVLLVIDKSNYKYTLVRYGDDEFDE